MYKQVHGGGRINCVLVLVSRLSLFVCHEPSVALLGWVSVYLICHSLFRFQHDASHGIQAGFGYFWFLSLYNFILYGLT